MSRVVVEAMFTLGDLKQTRIYQEAKLEGEKIGAQRGQILGRQQGLKQFAVNC